MGIHLVMRLWLQWIWPFLAICSLCQALNVYTYPTLKNKNQKEWLKNLYKMASTPQPVVKTDLGLEEFIHHAFRPTSMLGMNKRFEDPFNPKIHRAYYSRMALGSL